MYDMSMRPVRIADGVKVRPVSPDVLSPHECSLRCSVGCMALTHRLMGTTGTWLGWTDAQIPTSFLCVQELKTPSC